MRSALVSRPHLSRAVGKIEGKSTAHAYPLARHLVPFWACALPKVLIDRVLKMKKSIVLILALGLSVLYPGVTMAQPSKITENLRHEAVVVPLSIPDKTRMAEIDSLLFVESGEAVGVVFYYDDPATKALVDYIEFYDPDGHLLLIGWIDAFGICQGAMDRGLLNTENPKIDRILVTISLGREL